MSPDDIFAAQFWPWPDPAIKRDAQGRVLFVNAAFLALYGGQVENWRGNAIGGWPAPQAGGSAPYRFETRLPGADGSEQVYDWMEQSLADGNAFALARNVTVFTHAPQPDPTQSAVPEQQPAQSAAQEPVFEETPTQHVPSYDPEPSFAEVQPTQVEEPIQPIAETEVFEAPAIPDVPMLQAEAPSIPVPQIDIPEIDIPSDADYALTETAEQVSAAPQPPLPEPDLVEAPREFERRALPIEDESAVLGNNWRDAVIAKAVGAEDAAPEGQTNMGAENPAPEAAPQAEGGPIRILLAEDNANNALLTRTLLEAEGHTVDTVEDGALAVEAMKTASYDLIFMDMRMPNMDGLEATRKIRTLSNVSRTLPIIALTANAFDDDRNACFDSGMNDFMTKPVSAEELSEKVRDWTSDEAKARMMQAA
jgi:CheY-like chemotaxis protein